MLPALLAVTLLGGCGGDRMADLHQYVKQVEARPGGRIAPLPEVRPYKTFTYDASQLKDPFSPARLAGGVKAPVTSTSKIRPDTTRPREPLEAYSLDTLRMVGTIERGGHTWALVRAPDGTIFRVQDGNHMGQNYGKVVKITESRVALVEIVPDGMGGWMKRDASLALK
ncbi:MAG: pilus assembly protein PilP [Gammaproteobacteria bacterium]